MRKVADAHGATVLEARFPIATAAAPSPLVCDFPRGFDAGSLGSLAARPWARWPSNTAAIS